jgi:hypothetical protein
MTEGERVVAETEALSNHHRGSWDLGSSPRTNCDQVMKDNPRLNGGLSARRSFEGGKKRL